MQWCPIRATAQTNSGHLPQSTLPWDYPVSACLPSLLLVKKTRRQYSDNLGKTTECDVAGKIYHAGGFTMIIVQMWDRDSIEIGLDCSRHCRSSQCRKHVCFLPALTSRWCGRHLWWKWSIWRKIYTRWNKLIGPWCHTCTTKAKLFFNYGTYCDPTPPLPHWDSKQLSQSDVQHGWIVSWLKTADCHQN